MITCNIMDLLTKSIVEFSGIVKNNKMVIKPLGAIKYIVLNFILNIFKITNLMRKIRTVIKME